MVSYREQIQHTPNTLAQGVRALQGVKQYNEHSALGELP